MTLPLEFLFSSLFPIIVLEQKKAGNHSSVEAEPKTELSKYLNHREWDFWECLSQVQLSPG